MTLAERMGEGWRLEGIGARRGHCRVYRLPNGDYRAEFNNVLRVNNSTKPTPEAAVRSCLLGVLRIIEITRDDLEAVLSGVTSR